MIGNRSLNMDRFDAILLLEVAASDAVGECPISRDLRSEPQADGMEHRIGRRAFLSILILAAILPAGLGECGAAVSTARGKAAMFARKLG
jgi:hypothetical protein